MERRDVIVSLLNQVSGKALQPQPEQSLFESGLLDSFALPDLLSALEEKFSIKIPDSDLSPRKFDTLSRIEAYLDSRS